MPFIKCVVSALGYEPKSEEAGRLVLSFLESGRYRGRSEE